MSPAVCIKSKSVLPSDKVKAIDSHPEQPWFLRATFDGHVIISNTETLLTVRAIKVSDGPVRAAIFVPRMGKIITGSDDKMIRVYDDNTGKRTAEFAAHDDFIRSLAVHPTEPILPSCGDDGTIKQWMMDKEYALKATYKAHEHYAMAVAFDPKEPKNFASASLDNTIKVSTLDTPETLATLVGHDKGVNTVAFLPGSGSLLASGSDDRTIKIWDYKSGKCLHTLTGHADNVVALRVHSRLQLLLSASEDGTVKAWSLDGFGLVKTVSPGLGRAWCLTSFGEKEIVAIGCDAGTALIELEHGEEDVVDSQGQKKMQ